MAVTRTYRHGQTANPALIGLVVGMIVWLILVMAGNDQVGKADEVSRRTDLAVLALLKEQSMWVGAIVGGLTCLWAWQMRRLETGAERDAETFRVWSAALPQWKPEFAMGETAAFVVPLARVESGEYTRREPVAAAPVPVQQLGLTPVTTTRSVPVVRLAPLQELANRFAMAQKFAPQQVTSNRMPLAPAAQGGLVRAARVELPSSLPLEKISALPRTELERMAGECYRRQGYDVAALGHGDADSGVDLLCQRRGEVVIVKCLAAGNADVGMEQVRELLSLVMGEGATRGIFLTTGNFARKAVKFSHRKGGGRLELINGRQFASMIQATAAGAGTSPACPCCGGRMKMEMERKLFGRTEWSWNCDAGECPGVIRQGDAVPGRKLLAA